MFYDKNTNATWTLEKDHRKQ